MRRASSPLGAIMRSAAAFGASGIVVPERRAAGVTVAVGGALVGLMAADDHRATATPTDSSVTATTGPWLDVEAAPKEGATPTVGPGQSVAADGGAVWLRYRLQKG